MESNVTTAWPSMTPYSDLDRYRNTDIDWVGEAQRQRLRREANETYMKKERERMEEFIRDYESLTKYLQPKPITTEQVREALNDIRRALNEEM